MSSIVVTTFSKRRQTAHNILHLRIPLAFRKFSLCHFALQKDLHPYLFSPTERHLKRVFPSMKNKWKAGVFSVGFPAVQRPLHPEQAPPRSYISFTASRFDLCLWAFVLYFHLLGASLARCVLRLLLFRFTPILANRSVHRSALLSDSQGNL